MWAEDCERQSEERAEARTVTAQNTELWAAGWVGKSCRLMDGQNTGSCELRDGQSIGNCGLKDKRSTGNVD